MKKILVHTTIAFFTFLIGIGLPIYWYLSPSIPDVPVPETLIDCNFPVFTECLISKKDKKFWDDEILLRFEEISLSKTSDSSDESYRLVLLPTFDNPLVIRIWQKDNERFLTTKKLSGEGGFGIEKFGNLSYEKTRPLTEQEWVTAVKFINQTSFWRMSPQTDEVPVSDGASWSLEGIKEREYHEVHRTIPNKDFKTSCYYFLKLSGLQSEYKGY